MSGPYALLNVVREGDGYILGSRLSEDFVAVPAIGGEVVLWLQQGRSVEECGTLAERMAGEPVDVAGFVAGLVQAGLLPAGDEPRPAVAPGQGEVARWKRRLGRVPYGPWGLTVQTGLALAGLAALVAVPATRPSYTDVLVTGVPLVSVVCAFVITTGVGLVHEFAHVLAAWAVGVPSRISIDRRMFSVVLQTDLTRLWSVPRRARLVPLLAGMLVNAAIAAALILTEPALAAGSPSIALQLVRCAVFYSLGAIVAQFAIFLRTDVYALLVLASGCKNLWQTKGALARRLVRLDTAADRGHLAGTAAKERRWARVYLVLYVPGVLAMTWYFSVFVIPAVGILVTTSARTVAAHGFSFLGTLSAAALFITVAGTAYGLWGTARTAIRVATQLVRARRSSR